MIAGFALGIALAVLLDWSARYAWRTATKPTPRIEDPR